MKYAYFPGCSLESTAWDFDRSTRAVCRALGIELEEIPNWVCCGSTPAHSTNASLAVALPVLNLQKAQAMGRPVLTACASCYARLRTANHQVRNEPDAAPAGRAGHRQALRRRCRGPSRARRAGEPIRPGRHSAEGPATAGRPLAWHVTTAACSRGRRRSWPSTTRRIRRAWTTWWPRLGAEPVVWPYKTECCGASLSITRSSVVGRLGRKLLSMARQAGAAASWWPVPCASSTWICGSRMRSRPAATCPPRRSCTSRSSWALRTAGNALAPTAIPGSVAGVSDSGADAGLHHERQAVGSVQRVGHHVLMVGECRPP